LLVLSILSFTVYSLNKDLFFLFVDRFDSSYTAELRLDNWIKGFELFKDNWLFGLGVDNYNPTMENTFIEIDEGSTAAHNMFLKALYELGIFGFIPFILIFKKILYMMFSKQRHYIILLICSPLLIMGLSLSLTFEKYLWLVIAISFNSHFIKFFRNISLKYENSTFYTES
jgi:O-antigen ligase